MDYITVLIVLSFVWACINVLNFRLSRYSSSSKAVKLPPGPKPFPIIGNLLELGNKPHQSLANLSKTYGPLMRLKLGRVTTIVICSPSTAKQIVQKNDYAFSNRTIPEAAQALGHHKFSIGWLPVSAQWRNLRKICAIQMFSLQRLDASQALREEKVRQLLDHVQQTCTIGDQVVDIGQVAFITALNLLSNTFFSIDLAHYNLESSQEFKNTVSNIMELSGKPNIADYFPSLRLLDPQGIQRRMKFLFKRLLEIFDEIINSRLQAKASSVASTTNDVLDVLLNLTTESDSEFSCSNIKHLLMDLFVAGTDTTSITVEWAMAELLHNPKTMAKVRTELERVIGKRKEVQESDISSLPYLQAVVKENFRQHPSAPLLLPHKAEFDMEIDGFTIPKDAQVLINLWAITQDPSIWPNPTSFLPERFLEHKIDVKGQDFELIPFGAGRRSCPGMPLANRMVHLMLASLLHSFDWKLQPGIKPEDMDMGDVFGITLRKAKPLLAIPIKV